ncbi:PDZ domain-containing protein [Amphibacillus jilinensis]|uniref:PDZ domain-containing protein n=1 Tax=Amphibacillus jilinensis TaxID=1216008 RepID=UPI0003028BB3|nr:PDZ domain-containing protein [Amphibacillus jilinensis]
MELWFIEIAKGLGRFLLNPLLYWFIIITALASLTRIKEERQSFGSKIYPIFDEMYGQRLNGILFGLILSVAIMLLGLSLPNLMLLAIIFFTMLFSINKKFTWLSSAYTFGFTAIILLFSPYYHDLLPSFLQGEITALDWVTFTTIMGLFIVIEALMMRSIEHDQTFPEIFKGARGKVIGQHRLKRITLIPIIMFWPVGTLEFTTDWWPVIELNGTSYGLMIFPFVIGFEHVIRATLPTKAAKRFSQYLFILGLLVIATALLGYYIGLFSLVSVIVALVGREWLAYRLKMKDQQLPALFNPTEKGIKVLAILPGSPAVDLGLVVGDTVVKVNGVPITDPNDFYQALQNNRAFCKLDVIDERGEIRFVQRALYEHEHYQLGLVFTIDHQKKLAY